MTATLVVSIRIRVMMSIKVCMSIRGHVLCSMSSGFRVMVRVKVNAKIRSGIGR